MEINGTVLSFCNLVVPPVPPPPPTPVSLAFTRIGNSQNMTFPLIIDFQNLECMFRYALYSPGGSAYFQEWSV